MKSIKKIKKANYHAGKTTKMHFAGECTFSQGNIQGRQVPDRRE